MKKVNLSPVAWVCVLLGAWLVGGCAAPTVRRAAPPGPVLASLPGEASPLRGWGDEASPELRRSLAEAVARRRALGHADTERAELLALSGGGINGSFGAGFLVGWGETGGRPRFDLVTGISAGGLLAPFAFLGEEQDERLARFFREVEADKLFRRRGVLELLRADSLVDAAPLSRLLEEVYDEAMLVRIAEEHAKGRRLWVGTMNLDARRPVIWDLGAIAASELPERGRLFREVLRASAAVPGVFPPVYVEVEVDGRRCDEMHVDGGLGNQVFGYGVVMDERLAPDLRQAPARLWVIRNGVPRLAARPVEPRLTAIAAAAVGSLTHHQGDADLYRLQAFCARDGVEFRLVTMPERGLEPATPRELFELGRELARRGDAWRTEAPGFSEP